MSSTDGFNEGATLTANVVDADKFDAAAVVYSWQQQIGGTWQTIGTGQSHAIGFNDGGNNFRVLANYTDNAGHQESLQSQAMLAVDVDRPGSLGVTSSGGFVEGSTVTAQVTDPDGVGAVSYQWSSMGTDNLWHPIGANSASYTLTANEAGKQIDVVATYIDNQGHHDTAADPFTVAAPPPPPPNPGPGTPLPTSSADGFWMGINLSGGEQSVKHYPQVALPGIAGFDYQFPTHAEIDYYATKGFELIRLPLLWERLEPTLNGPLDPSYLAQIEDVVGYATSKGIKVDIDPHNYGEYNGQLIGSAQVPVAAFATLWSKLAADFVTNPDVIFGLMNEPTMPDTQWLPAVNAAIAAIRATGADQEIWVPGNNNTGAAWPGSENANVLVPGVVDPLHNYAFEIHQYLDPGRSGSSPVISATEGVTDLTAVTQWAAQNHVRLVLGEIGVGTEATDLVALDNTLNYMTQHTDVWQSVAYWAGGPLWNSFGYRLSAEPTGIGTSNVVDKPQMAILEHYMQFQPHDTMPIA